MQARTRQALKLALSAACLAAVSFFIDPGELAARLRETAWPPLAGAMGLNLLLQGVNALKLRLLFPAPRPPLRLLVRVNFIAVFFGTFLPGGVGGEVARWVWLGRETGSGGSALAAILVDRVTGLWAQVLLALFAGLWMAWGTQGHHHHLSLAALAAAPAALLVVGGSLWAGLEGSRRLVGWARRLGAWYARRDRPAGRVSTPEVPGPEAAEGIGDALAYLLASRGRLLVVAALSLGYHVLVIVAFLLLDRSIGGSLGWDEAGLLLLLYTVVLLAPVTLGSWGLSEGTLGVLYHYAGSGSATGVLLSLLLRLMALPAALVGWALFLLGPGKAHRRTGAAGPSPDAAA